MEVLTADIRRTSERGVSLVETLVALLILAFVAVSTLSMFSQGMRLNAAGSDYSMVTNLAKDKAEELLAMQYTSPLLDPFPATPYEETHHRPNARILWRVGEHTINQGSSDIGALFAGDPMVSTVVTANTGNLKVISVTVTVNPDSVFGVGRRNVTVQGMKSNPQWIAGP